MSTLIIIAVVVLAWILVCAFGEFMDWKVGLEDRVHRAEIRIRRLENQASEAQPESQPTN